MKKEEKKVDFDMSLLSLSDLIKLYEDVNGFLQLLGEKKIIIQQEEKGEEENE